MNNQMPFIMPNKPLYNQEINNDYERIINKIDRLEKNIKILENRVNNLEKNQSIPKYSKDDPTDMYII